MVASSISLFKNSGAEEHMVLSEWVNGAREESGIWEYVHKRTYGFF